MTTGSPENRPISPTAEELKKNPETTHRSVSCTPPPRNIGKRSVGMLYGWIFFSHQIGAALASYIGGLAYDLTGSYDWAFISAGILGVLAAGLVLAIREPSRPAPRPLSAHPVPAMGD